MSGLRIGENSVSVEIKLEPCVAPDVNIVAVAGVTVGTVQRLGDGSFIPYGCKKPRSLAEAALKLCTAQYDRCVREADKYGLLIEELMK